MEDPNKKGFKVIADSKLGISTYRKDRSDVNSESLNASSKDSQTGWTEKFDVSSMEWIDVYADSRIKLPLKPFEHDRYKILCPIDRGNWGIAYYVEDNITGLILAAKEYDISPLARIQLEERRLKLEDVILKEFTRFMTPDKVVPSMIEKDKNGKLILLMPAFETDFEEMINFRGYTVGWRNYLDSGLTLKEIISYGSDIATGISGFHKTYKAAHCDIKPKNIFSGRMISIGYNWSTFNSVYDGLWLSDSGTRTGSSIIDPDASRSNIGFIYTRAPENFREDARPDECSDVWSFGSLMYRLFTGKYALEDEMAGCKDLEKYVKGLDMKTAKGLIKEKSGNVPRQFRGFLRTCLNFDISGKNPRYANGMEMKQAWDEIVSDFNIAHFLMGRLNHYMRL